uniref:Uncharacterized protein n=1 Tax=Tanacetum cinerariifolium TaxID=118510 RepID=A0A699HUT2_TANCI|nr:hypothetical protein [Tanacetum cinerariifolium]
MRVKLNIREGVNMTEIITINQHETNENELGSESDQEENEEELEYDEEEEEDEFVKTLSNHTNDEDETMIKDKAEGDKDKGIDYTTNQFDDDVNVGLNEPVDTDEGLNIPHTDAEIISPLDVHVHHEFLAKESSQPKSTYEGAALLTEFELKKFLIDKMDERLKKRKTSKDAKPTKGPKTKESTSGSSKGTKSKSKFFGKSVQPEEPEFEVVVSDMPQYQEENLGNDDKEPKRKVSSKRDWFTKPKQPEDPIDPDWNVGKTPQQGPTQSWLMTLASLADKPSKTFDELMSTLINFFEYIMNVLKITNLTQETLLGPAIKLLKGIHTNYAKLEYDFENVTKLYQRNMIGTT